VDRKIDIFLRWFAIGFVSAALCGCSAQWHLRRAINKAPELFRDTTAITTIKIDPIPPIDFKTRLERDSLVTYYDTVEDVRISYRYITETDSIEVVADCPDQETKTITKKVRVAVRPSFWERLEYAIYVLALLLAALLITHRP